MIRKYNANSDYPLICSWYFGRNMVPPNKEHFPKNGYIISEKMALFICATDSCFAILEFFISDKNTVKEQRKVLTDLLVSYCIDECKSLGFKYVQAFVEHPGSISSLSRNGFELKSKTVNFFHKELV